jgi:Ca2+/H+ antiporter, TMEM165/GDT1 family
LNILVILATFLAAGVEWVEALTIVLAVGIVRGWKSAFVGMTAALVALIALIAGFGIAITSHVSISAARTVVGVFLLLFGLKWLYKAILRSSGLRSLHDEAKTYRETTEMLETSRGRTGIDRVGISTSFGGVFLEGLEVVFIVVALGGLENVASAIVGALVSLVVVAAAGIALRTPLTQVPENTMKYVVGIMLTSFGTFFAGEGIGVQWWQSDLSLLPLIAAYALASIAFVLFLKRTPRAASGRHNPILHGLQTAVLELWGLFVDDGALAVVAVVVLFAIAWYTDHVSGQRGVAAVLLVVGVVAAIAIGLTGPYRKSRQAAKADAKTVATGEHDQPPLAVVPQETLVPR